MTEPIAPAQIVQTNPPKREKREPRELTREEKIKIALPIIAKAVGKVLLIPAIVVGYVFAVLIGVLVGEVFSAIGGGRKG